MPSRFFSAANAKRAFFWTLLAIFAVIPLILLEISLRWMGLGDPVLYYTNTSYRFAPLPDQVVKRRRDATVTIDSFGLRGIEDWGLETGTRILFIGDSVTWSGTNIDDEQSFAHLVCDRLEKVYDRGFTCGNAGVNAYGTDNMTERLRYKDFDNENIIVVTIIAEDTIRGLVDLRKNPLFSRKPPQLCRAIWEATAYSLSAIALEMRFQSGQKELKYQPGQVFENDDLEVSERSLTRLFDILREEQTKGKMVLLAFSPYEWELPDRPSNLTNHVRSLLKESGFPVIDFTNVLERDTSGIFYDGTHLDARGHELYASIFAQELKKFLDRNGDITITVPNSTLEEFAPINLPNQP